MTQRMDPTIKARWLEALRSGEYEQTTEELRSKAGCFCCLGVLCHLFTQEDGSEWNHRRLSELDDPADLLPDNQLPGPRIAIWSGLDWDQMVSINGTTDTLYNHNDGGRTFAQIADAIEAQL